MHNEFTAIVERDGDWFVAYAAEVPGANGQGLSEEECLASLADAIELILQDRREDALRGIPEGVVRRTVAVGGSGQPCCVTCADMAVTSSVRGGRILCG